MTGGGSGSPTATGSPRSTPRRTRSPDTPGSARSPSNARLHRRVALGHHGHDAPAAGPRRQRRSSAGPRCPARLDVLSMLAVDDSVWVAIMDQDRLVRVTSQGVVAASVRMPDGYSIFDEFDPQLGSSSDGRTIWSMTAGKELVAVDIGTARVVDRILIHNGPWHSQVAVARRHRVGPVAGHQHGRALRVARPIAPATSTVTDSASTLQHCGAQPAAHRREESSCASRWSSWPPPSCH